MVRYLFAEHAHAKCERLVGLDVLVQLAQKRVETALDLDGIRRVPLDEQFPRAKKFLRCK